MNQMLPIIIALDFDSKEKALNLLEKLDPKLCRVKIGKAIFTRLGPEFVRLVISMGFEVFLDLKFHDIPNTVYDACRAAAELGVWMLNVHALGGDQMLIKAKEAVGDSCKLIAVTILTSMNDIDLKRLGSPLTTSEMVLRLASLACQHKLDGVVASSHEASFIKSHFKGELQVIAPGIRLTSDPKHDQKRVMTPGEAIKQGVDYLVIGRSITQAKDPLSKLNEIQLDIASYIME